VRLAGVLVPGRGYTTQAPLLSLADEALSDRGFHREHISWNVPEGMGAVGYQAFVQAHVAAALHRTAAAWPGARTVVIAKSLGTYAAPLVAEQSLPAIWLTPILTSDAVLDAVRASTAPTLLIGGTADQLWDSRAALSTGKPILEIPGANHALRPPGPLPHYLDALRTVTAAIEEFLDAL
jgi:hypothetical protein